MKSVQQEFIWSEPPLTANEAAGQPSMTESLFPSPLDSRLEELRPRPDDRPWAAEPCEPPRDKATEGPPIAKPRRQAVDAGVFGMTDEGPVDPDEEEVAAIATEHVLEMIVLLFDLNEVDEAIRSGRDPHTGRVPKTPEKQRRLADHLQKEKRRLTDAYADVVAIYADAFGNEAAAALNDWVKKTVEDGGQRENNYDPGHPWHYYATGDNAAPIPVEEIPAASDVGQWLERELPKNRVKRLVRVREMLETEAQRLEESQRRYVDVVQRGAAALSRYDREIAYGGNDELARSGTIALKFNHICWGRGRVQWLQAELKRLAGGEGDCSKRS